MIRSIFRSLINANCGYRASRNLFSSSRLTQEQNAQNESFPSLLTDETFMNVKKQNFGAVPISDCSRVAGLRHVNEFEQRNHLTFDDVSFMDLPIVNIKAKWNTTQIKAHHKETEYSYVSCQSMGFKNAKKKTTHASEMTGKAAAEKAIMQGCLKHVRVVLDGIGPGRKAAIKGLTLGGMNVVSITDVTPITNNGLCQRPRKIRRL